jgi:hypothetical protein
MLLVLACSESSSTVQLAHTGVSVATGYATTAADTACITAITEHLVTFKCTINLMLTHSLLLLLQLLEGRYRPGHASAHP